MTTRLSILAVAATLATLAALPAMAGPFGGPGGFANPGGGGGGGAWKGGGGYSEPVSPGDPFYAGASDSCSSGLGSLRPVKAAQIRAVDEGDSVAIVPVCAEDLQRNIAQLRPHIAANEVLDDELGQAGRDAGDVVGIKLRGGDVVLYVR